MKVPACPNFFRLLLFLLFRLVCFDHTVAVVLFGFVGGGRGGGRDSLLLCKQNGSGRVIRRGEGERLDNNPNRAQPIRKSQTTGKIKRHKTP